ncbi:hypothetical protein LYZ88_21655, partial [Xanthomonas hortorum pv. vitians]|nr:hypothetical protein [Xanthomonas hortorum pv. vitians]MCE4522309.1 hypothetical protein [Xanthomonas hortorum pv. vitians]
MDVQRSWRFRPVATRLRCIDCVPKLGKSSSAESKMKYTIEINATVQVAHYMTVEASSPQEALAQCDVDTIAN